MDEKMSKEINKVTGMYAQSAHYGVILKKFINKKIKEVGDIDYTKKLIDELSHLYLLMLVKSNRIKVIFLSLLAERKYVEENDITIDKSVKDEMRTQSFITMRYWDDFITEFKFLYALIIVLKASPITEKGEIARAIRHYIKKNKQRFSGKNNSVDLLINDLITYSPLLPFSTKMARENRTIWEGVNDYIPYIKIIYNKEYKNSYENDDFDIDSRMVHTALYPIIEWIYKNEKFNYMERRHLNCGITEEKADKIKKEKEENKERKIQERLNVHLDRCIKAYSNWFNNPNTEISKPRGYDKFIKEREGDNLQYVIIAVKHDINKYISGYLTNDPVKPIANSLKGIYTYPTAKEAVDAIAKFKADGVIDIGTAVII